MCHIVQMIEHLKVEGGPYCTIIKKKHSKREGGPYCTSGKNIKRDKLVHIVQAVKTFKGRR